MDKNKRVKQLQRMDNKKVETLNEFVQVENLVTNNGTSVYLMKIAGIPIRPYITIDEVNRIAEYMKMVVNTVLYKVEKNKALTGKDLVNVEETVTKAGTFYLLTIADMHLRGYVEGYESIVQKNFMIDVVDEVIKQALTA
jgi:hypothetical protein